MENFFKHPSAVSLFGLYDKLNFPSTQGKTVSQVIEENPRFFEWALISSSKFCFDDYTYNLIQQTSFIISEEAHKKQLEKRRRYNQDILEYNESYVSRSFADITDTNVKLYKLDYKIGFGQYAESTIKELIEKSPSRIEFFIQSLPWFGLASESIIRFKACEPNFLFLKSTIELLALKYDEAPNSMKGEQRRVVDDDSYSDNQPYSLGNPKYDEDENPWLGLLGDEDDEETAYWNTN